MCLKMLCTPFYPMVLLIILPIKWLFHWEYTHLNMELDIMSTPKIRDNYYPPGRLSTILVTKMITSCPSMEPRRIRGAFPNAATMARSPGRLTMMGAKFLIQAWLDIASGKHTKNYGKSPFIVDL